MATWTTSCALLYGIYTSDSTYTVPTVSGSVVEIDARTVRREEFDPRVGSGTNPEFFVDRFGWAACSEITGRLEASYRREAMSIFISDLINLIAQVRDLFEGPWIQEVEEEDLFNLTVGTGTTRGLWANARHPYCKTGLNKQGEEHLAARLNNYEPVAS